MGHEVLNNIGNSLSNLRRLSRRVDPAAAEVLDSLRVGLTSSAALLQGQAVREFVLRGADLRGSQEAQNASATLAAIVADFVRDGGARGVTVTSTGVADVSGVLVNRMLARIILRNIFDNAIEVVQGSQARISIEVERGPEHHVTVTCRDNGPGMTREQLEAAFALGHTTKAGHSGAGLPIVHFLLESVGGAVTATSVPGTGTSITVLLPCKPVDAHVASAPR